MIDPRRTPTVPDFPGSNLNRLVAKTLAVSPLCNKRKGEKS